MYLSSLILGSLYHANHLSRAVYSRCSQVAVTEPYILNMPLLSSITSPECRQPGKAPNFSCNWLVGETANTGLEVVSVMQGKTEQGAPSRLCKAEMYRMYGNIWGKIPARSKTAEIPPTYDEAKRASAEYDTCKQMFVEGLAKAKLGTWVKKPEEEEMFTLPTGEVVVPTVPKVITANPPINAGTAI